MTESPGFIFLSPAWLLLAPVALVLIYTYTYFLHRISMWSKVCDARLLRLLTAVNSQGGRPNRLRALLIAVFGVGVIAMAGPSWQQQDYALLESVAARVLVLDLSQSMLVEDVKPNRLDQALDAARKIVTSGFDGETALVVFAGASFVVSPLTRDGSTLLEFLKALKPSTMPLDGSRLDLAIGKAQSLLSTSATKTGQLIIITDGIDKPNLAADAVSAAASQGNQVLLLAVGTSQGAPLKDTGGGLQRDSDGRFILARINFSELETIAFAANGGFVKLSESNSNIDSSLFAPDYGLPAAAPNAGENPAQKPVNGGIWLVWLMLPLLLMLFRNNIFWILLIVIIAPFDSELYALEFGSLWLNPEQRAYQAFQLGDYERVENLSNNPALVGSALFRQRDYQSALERFSEQDTASAYFNRANVLAFQLRFEEALLLFQRALELDPAFADALFNKQLIETYLSDQAPGDGELGDDAGEEAAIEEQAYDPSRPGGVSNVEAENRSTTEQAGIGASLQLGQGEFNEDEEYSGDLQLEQFLLRLQNDDFTPDPAMIKLWTQSLNTDPTELFRRKFLRDYQRNLSERR